MSPRATRRPFGSPARGARGDLSWRGCSGTSSRSRSSRRPCTGSSGTASAPSSGRASSRRSLVDARRHEARTLSEDAADRVRAIENRSRRGHLRRPPLRRGVAACAGGGAGPEASGGNARRRARRIAALGGPRRELRDGEPVIVGSSPRRAGISPRRAASRPRSSSSASVPWTCPPCRSGPLRVFFASCPGSTFRRAESRSSIRGSAFRATPAAPLADGTGGNRVAARRLVLRRTKTRTPETETSCRPSLS